MAIQPLMPTNGVNNIVMDPSLIGYLAASLTTISFFPQAIKTLRSGDTRGISLRMYCLFTFRSGVVVDLWLGCWQWPGFIRQFNHLDSSNSRIDNETFTPPLIDKH